VLNVTIRRRIQSTVLPYNRYTDALHIQDPTCYVLPLAQPSDIGCLYGADALAIGFSEKACRCPSLAKVNLFYIIQIPTNG